MEVCNCLSCAQCGGELQFDITTQNVKCPYCGYVEEFEKSFQIDRHSLSEAENWSALKNKNEEKTISCSSCGSKSVIPYLTSSSKCSYCGSTNISEIEDESLMEPDCVIPFIKDKYEVDEIFKKWVKTRIWAPRDFKLIYQQGKLNASYSPAWSYNADTSYTYRGKGGIIETYTVEEDGKKVRKQKTTWYSTRGSGQESFEKVFVSDSSKNNALIKGILDEGGLDLYKYDPKYLYSFSSEHYYEGVLARYPESQRIMKNEIREMARQEILRRYDVANVEEVNVNFKNVTFSQVLVPVWSSMFYYNDKEYRVVINGYNGDIEGESPISVVKVIIAIVVVIIAAIIIYMMSK